MKQFNTLKNTKGFAKAYEAALKWRAMQNEEEVKRRAKALTFWEAHGTDAACDAFAVSRRTLYRWRATLVSSHGNISALDPKSTAPKRRRVREISPELEQALIRWRTEHPGIGKKKLTPLLRKEGLSVSEPYIGRCIADLKARGCIPVHTKLSWYAKSGIHRERRKTKVKKLRRRHKRGIEIDTVVRHIEGTKRYTLTAIDVQKRLAYARTYTSHSSDAARDFLKHLIRYVPFDITEIQTDNGSEFAKHFHTACEALNIKQYHTYPRCPKMNAHIERFNRTLSEEFLMRNRMCMATDLDVFNQRLRKWLYWYNFQRPHESLGLRSPMEYIIENNVECQMY